MTAPPEDAPGRSRAPRRRSRTRARLSLLVRRGLTRVAFRAARLLPVRDRVVLATSHARAISGNMALIRDEIERRAAGPVVVLAYRSERGMRGRFRAMAAAVRAGYHLATARLFLVDDYFFPMYLVRPRPDTWRVQVWHASGAFKMFGYSLREKTFGTSPETLSVVRIHSNYDLCLVSSMRVAPHYAEAFGQPLERFVSQLGIPRTDLLFGPDVAARADAVRRQYGLEPADRTILFAPTFRGDSVLDARYADQLDLAELRRLLGPGHRLLLRVHPFVRERLALPDSLADFVADASGHPDIHDLMLASDLLVTDYSSAIYEYSLLGRPILFFAPDLEAYERERGFYFDYRSGVPGPIVETAAQLADCVRSGRFDLERVSDFAARSFDVADGHATARFVDQVVTPALRGRRRWLEAVLADGSAVDAVSASGRSRAPAR